jgi:hypothetical protein
MRVTSQNPRSRVSSTDPWFDGGFGRFTVVVFLRRRGEWTSQAADVTR